MGIVPYLDSVRIRVEYVNLVDLFLNEIFVEYLFALNFFFSIEQGFAMNPVFSFGTLMNSFCEMDY